MTSIVTRGDTGDWEIPLTQTSNGQPYPLNGMAVWVTVKRDVADPDEDALYQHSIHVALDGTVIAADGLAIKDDDPSLGVVVQVLPPEVSATFDPGSYQYDVQVMLPNGKIKTPINGDPETVVPDYTRAIVPPEAP